jgi:hypothetical protein
MRTEMQCMQADMRAEMRREMESLREEVRAKDEQIRELVRHATRLEPEPEPEPEPELAQEAGPEREPERPSMEAMLLQMLDDAEAPNEPTVLSTAGATEEAWPDLQEELDIRSIVNDLLDEAVEKMNLSKTAAQVSDNEPPVMRELANELLDTVIDERMSLPQMKRSDFRDVAQELLDNAIDLAVDKPTRCWSKELRTTARDLGMVPTWESPDEHGAQNETQDNEDEHVDVRGFAGDLIDAAIERMPILSEWPYLPNDVADIHTVTTELISDALDKMDLPETIEEIDARYEATEAAPPVMGDFAAELVDTAVDKMGLPEMNAPDLRVLTESLIDAALDRMPITNEPKLQEAPDKAGQQLVDLAAPAVSAENAVPLIDPQAEQPLEDRGLVNLKPPLSEGEAESKCQEAETDTGDGTSLQFGRELAGQLLDLAMERMDLPSDEAKIHNEGEDDFADDEADAADNTGDGTSLQFGREVAWQLLDLAMERMVLPSDEAKIHNEGENEAEVAILPANVEAAAAAVTLAENSELPDDAHALHDEMETKKQMVKKTIQLS